MEEESIQPQTVEETAPSASETSAPEAETSEVATSEQPAEEATGEQPKSRVQERIKKLANEKNYWKDLAQSSAPQEKDESNDEVTVEEVARRTAQEVRASLRQEEAQKSLMADAANALNIYPELDSDNELAADVVALAQGRGISITQAADRLIANRRAAEEKAAQQVKAEQALRTGVSAPQGQKVSTGSAPAKPDLLNMNSDEKRANWSKIIESYSSEE